MFILKETRMLTGEKIVVVVGEGAMGPLSSAWDGQRCKHLHN